MYKVSRVVERRTFGNLFLASKPFHKNSHGNETSIIGNRHRRWLEIGGGTKRFYAEDTTNIVNSPLGEVKIPDLPLHDYIFENWSLWENKTAVECVKTGKKYSFKLVRRYSKALAAAFQNKLNLSKGDVIALVLPNCCEYPIAILGASQSGVVPTTVNPTYTVDEIYRHLQDSKAKLIITDTKAYEKCFTAVSLMKASFPILIVKHTPSDEVPQGGIDLVELFNHSISGEFRPIDIDGSDVFVLPYSSGTTGGPKGVILSHSNVVSNLTQLNHPETNVLDPTTRFNQQRTFAILPMFHIFGMMTCTFFSLREGCRLFILPTFNIRTFVTSLYMKKVNILFAVPPVLRILSNEQVKRRYIKRLKYIVNGASALPLHDAHIILDKAGHIKIVQGYGMTESSPVLTHTSAIRMQNLSSIGIPIASTKLKIVNPETGELLPKGKEGELCAWGPQVMKGYLNRPEETKNAFDQDGWLKTGDMAYYDENKDFFIVQRLKELIKVKGYQVSPSELEEILKSHPKISDAVVVGIPHPEHGEIPRAFVILQPEAQMTEEEVKEFTSKKLAHYKQLRGGVRFVDDFPRNRLGKVLRVELQKMP